MFRHTERGQKQINATALHRLTCKARIIFYISKSGKCIKISFADYVQNTLKLKTKNILSYTLYKLLSQQYAKKQLLIYHSCMTTMQI